MERDRIRCLVSVILTVYMLTVLHFTVKDHWVSVIQ